MTKSVDNPFLEPEDKAKVLIRDTENGIDVLVEFGGISFYCFVFLNEIWRSLMDE